MIVTKAEVKAFLADAKRAITRAEGAVALGDVHRLADEVRAAGGFVGEVESACDHGDLADWKRVCPRIVPGGRTCRKPSVFVDGLCLDHGTVR